MTDFLENAKSILLLSIKPKYVDKLVDGSKCYELRRVKPRVTKGDVVIIYESSPTMAIVGFGIVNLVIADQPSKMWSQVSSLAGVNKEEYDQYYLGANFGYAINFSKIISLSRRVPLKNLRKKVNGFHPPQSYRYLCTNEALSLCFA